MSSPLGKPAPSEWIRAYARVQIAADTDIIRILAQAQQSINADMARIAGSGLEGIGDALRYEQMALIRQSIMREQAKLLRQVGQVVEARRLEAAAQAITLSGALDSYVLQAIGRPDLARELTEGLTRGLARTTQVALARMELSYTALSQRIYNTDVWLGSRVDQKITAALARGLTAREFAREAADWFDPHTPGGIRYAAMRLARSEINNAFHAVSVQQAQDKPWVHSMKWHLSGSHPRADICDEYAHEDKYDLGPGVFPKKDVPRKPHPHCFCYVTSVEIDEDEFLDSLVSGKFDRYIEDRRQMATVAQPKLPSVASVQRKAVTRSAPSPGEASAATRIANSKKMFGDFEANPAILGQMSITDLRSLARAYGAPGTGTRPQLIAAIRGKMPKRPTAAPVKRAKPAPTKATPAPAPRPVSPSTQAASLPPPKPVARPATTEVVARTPAKTAELEAAVARQTQLAPNAMGKLLRSSEMTAEEAAEFARRFGQDAVGGYISGQYRLVLHSSAFSARATAALRAEVRSGYSSRIGDGVSGLDGTYAHEFGHHLSYLARALGPQRTKGVWDTLADGAGVPRPLFYDQASLDKWVAKHADALGSAVSRYGATDADELLAEVWAEFSTNPDARDYIQRTAVALRDLAEEIAIMI